MIKTENKITKQQKRIIYIALVMMFLATLFTFLYLLFVLVNFQGQIVVLDDNTTIAIGGVLAILGAMFGNPLGKKWWQLVYLERKRGAFLKVNS